MTMQDNIDIIGRNIRRNMFEPKSQTPSLKIDNQRPLGFAVAISAHNRDRRTDRAQFVQNAFRADISQMPDLIRLARDRKSTRLNSSHSQISYAVFCLKK